MDAQKGVNDLLSSRCSFPSNKDSREPVVTVTGIHLRSGYSFKFREM